MAKADIKALAEFLNDAEVNPHEVTKITLDHPELTIEDAYDIQYHIVDMKKQGGSKVVGLKMGMTSEAKMKQMNVSDPIYGHLFDYMLIDNHGKLSVKELVHPRVEAEIAFVMDKDLSGPNVTEADVVNSIRYVFPVMEIVDSRYENFNFTLIDVVADNCSSSRVILGNKFTKPDGLDMDLLGVTLSINNEIVDIGAGASVLGHPLKPVVMLAKMLAQRGSGIKAGSLILTGGITKAIHLKVGDQVTTRIHTLGEVSFTVVE